MSKFDKFEALETGSQFEVRDAIKAFATDEDPKRVGRKAMVNAAKVDLDQIIAKDQVRTEYDPEKHLEMVASLKAHGQQQPVVLYWSDEDERYVVFMGHRRFRAAKEVDGLTSLAAIVLDQPPTESERLEKQLVENLIREDLNPVDEARAFADIMEVRGCTAQDLAKELGKAPSTVQRAVKMLQLPEDILQDVAAGAIPKSIVREVQKLDTENEQRQRIAEYKSGATYTEIAQKVTKKPGLRSEANRQVKKKTSKSFTSRGIKIQASADRKATKLEIAIVLREMAASLEADGRGKKVA